MIVGVLLLYFAFALRHLASIYGNLVCASYFDPARLLFPCMHTTETCAMRAFNICIILVPSSRLCLDFRRGMVVPHASLVWN